MTDVDSDAIVTTEWLADNLDDPGLRIVNAAGGSVTSRGTGAMDLNLTGDARTDFEAHHIPGAALVDFDVLSDRDNSLANMLPNPEQFGTSVGELGIGNSHRVIVYDCLGVRVSPRVWWMFRVFGHDNVAVLDGGLPKWIAEGRSVATGNSTHPPQTFTPSFRPALVHDVHQMVEVQKSREKPVYDARPSGRYDGVEPEPRGGIPSGHMPWSVNVPVEAVVDPSSGTVFPAEAIHSNLTQRGVELGRPAVLTCGWGIAACTIAFGLYLLGQKDASVYDGSWLEWAARDEADIVT